MSTVVRKSSFCGVVWDCQLAFGFLMVGNKKNAIDRSFLCTIVKFHLGCREVWKCHFFFFWERKFLQFLCWEGGWMLLGPHCHIVPGATPHTMQICPLYPPPPVAIFAHFILPRSSHFVATSHKLWGSGKTSLPKSCQSKFSNLCIDHYWPCAMIIRPERQRYILQ